MIVDTPLVMDNKFIEKFSHFNYLRSQLLKDKGFFTLDCNIKSTRSKLLALNNLYKPI